MDRTNASVSSSQRTNAAKSLVNLSMTWDHPSLPEPEIDWDSQDAEQSLNYDASASSFQPTSASTSLSLTAPIVASVKFRPSYLHVDADDGTGQGTTYMLTDMNRLTITTTSSEGEESALSSGSGGSKPYTSSSSMMSQQPTTAAHPRASLSLPCSSPLSASSSSLSLSSPPMSPTSSDYTRALRELEELAREEDWGTSASEYESDADTARGRNRSSSGEKERSDRLLAPRNYMSSSLFRNPQPTAIAAPVVAPPAVVSVSAPLSASVSVVPLPPVSNVVAASSSQPSANLPPLPPPKGSAVAFTIHKKTLPSPSSSHNSPSPPSAASPSASTSSLTPTHSTQMSPGAVSNGQSSSSPSHTRSLSRQMRRRTAETGAVLSLSRPGSRPDSRAGSRANSPPRGNSPHTAVAALAAAPTVGNSVEESPLPAGRQLKRGSSSRRRTWNHSSANSLDDATLAFDLNSRRTSLHRADSSSSPSLSVAASTATSPRASVLSASRQAAQTESESLKQRRARRQLSQSWMNSPVSADEDDEDLAPRVHTTSRKADRRRSRSLSPSRSLLSDPHALAASTSSASSVSSATETTHHRRQLSTPPTSSPASSCPVLPAADSFHGTDTRASSLPSPLTNAPNSAVPLPSPPLLASTNTMQHSTGDKVALVLEGRQIAMLSLAAVQQLLDGHRGGKSEDAGERDGGRGSVRGGRRFSSKMSDEENGAVGGRRNERSSDESEDEEDRAARARLQSQRRRSQKRLSVRTSKADPTVLVALHRREQSIDG